MVCSAGMVDSWDCVIASTIAVAQLHVYIILQWSKLATMQSKTSIKGNNFFTWRGDVLKIVGIRYLGYCEIITKGEGNRHVACICC